MRSKFVHTIELDQREHLSVLSCINADVGKIQNFYILKGTYFQQEYIKNCEEDAVIAMQPNVWMSKWFFDYWISHFIGTLRKTTKINEENMHLLVLNGHNSHVTLEVVTSTMNFGLNIIFRPSHTTHALQPLNVSCFKPFKSAFRQIRDFWMLLNKGRKVEKTTLCEWTSQALERSLTPKNIKSDFQKTGIWPLDNTATTNRMEPSREFEEGGQEIQPHGEEDSNEDEFVDDFEGGSSVQSCDDLDSNFHDLSNMVTEGEINSETEFTRYESSSRTRHFYVDVPNPEESNYDLNDQHITIDPEFREELKRRNDNNIDEFLSLPELITAKTRKKQQPLLDYTKSIILTSRD